MFLKVQRTEILFAKGVGALHLNGMVNWFCYKYLSALHLVLNIKLKIMREPFFSFFPLLLFLNIYFTQKMCIIYVINTHFLCI